MQPSGKPKIVTTKSSGTDWIEPPSANDIEFTLFGPGFGECGLVHIGDGRWIVIDSCVIGNANEPIALSYLRKLGFDPVSAVVCIVATHWHDDHVRGIADLVEACPNALFVCSSALTRKEFGAMVQAFDGQRMVRASSGVTEINRVFEFLRDKSRPRPKHAIAGRKVFQIEAAELSHGAAVSCIALSPSDRDDELARMAIGSLIPREKVTQYRCPAEFPNLMSVALHVAVGSVHMLFGADLEHCADAGRGWKAVMSDTTLPRERSVIFKIPHHGGYSAYSDAVWQQLLEFHPLAVATPWQRAGQHLPTDCDIDRIVAQTSNGFLTTIPKLGPTQVVGRPAAVQRTLREMGVKLTRIDPLSGAVRFRRSLNTGGEWSVMLHGSAYGLSTGAVV